MTNYNDGNWHPIPSGQPDNVHDKTEVEMVWRLRGGGRIKAETRPASCFAWPDGDDTENIAFRVVKEYREPREFWINEYSNDNVLLHTSKEESDKWADNRGRLRCIHVREVLE